MHCGISNNFVGSGDKSQRRKRDWQIIRRYHRKRTPLLLYARSSDWKNEEGEREKVCDWDDNRHCSLFPPLSLDRLLQRVSLGNSLVKQRRVGLESCSSRLQLQFLSLFFSYLVEIFLPLSACAPDETAKATKKKQTLRKTRKIQIPIYKCLCYPSVRTQTSLKFFLHLNFLKIFSWRGLAINKCLFSNLCQCCCYISQ